MAYQDMSSNWFYKKPVLAADLNQLGENDNFFYKNGFYPFTDAYAKQTLDDMPGKTGTHIRQMIFFAILGLRFKKLYTIQTNIVNKFTDGLLVRIFCGFIDGWINYWSLSVNDNEIDRDDTTVFYNNASNINIVNKRINDPSIIKPYNKTSFDAWHFIAEFTTSTHGIRDVYMQIGEERCGCFFHPLFFLGYENIL